MHPKLIITDYIHYTITYLQLLEKVDKYQLQRVKPIRMHLLVHCEDKKIDMTITKLNNWFTLPINGYAKAW